MAKKPTDYKFAKPLRLSVRRNADGWFVVDTAKGAERIVGPFSGAVPAQEHAEGLVEEAQRAGRDASYKVEFGKHMRSKGWR